MIDFKQLDGQRLQAALAGFPDALQSELGAWLDQPGFDATVAPDRFQYWQQQAGLDADALMLALLPLASCLALPGVSHFYVGAVLLGRSGRLYFGANLEFPALALAQTVHAEQSAITNAWLHGETGLDTLAVNYSPCGHCRQFMNELVAAQELRILLPGRGALTLADYLPDAFGPADLDIDSRLLADQARPLGTLSSDPLHLAATEAAGLSHAPYSGTLAGVALGLSDGALLCGRYAENAAFNPSLPPLQSALIAARLQRRDLGQASRLVLAEKASGLASQLATTKALAKVLGLPRVEHLTL
ncbi:cytidine deaminase [Gallaecimonas sp. GXIMD4217]|uniref:cytidine deaminase n=1 Tax=Gallaecimonas sp. GXIMD4217 TaxID=3131927 RepID=UPI00311B0C72